MPHESLLAQELGTSLEIFEEMLEDDRVLERIYESLDKEESEPAPNCHGPVVYQCIDRFVESELNLVSEVSHGLGRKDETFPRLGHYLRKVIERFTADNTLAFKLLLFDLVKSGYDFMVLVECSGGKGLKMPVLPVFEPLFVEWVNRISDFKFESLGPGTAVFRDKFVIARLKMLSEEIEPFGLFELFARDARLQHIFRMYVIAGLVLRLTEAYYHQ